MERSPKDGKNKSPEMSRRGFMFGAASSAATLAGMAALYEKPPVKTEEEEVVEEAKEVLPEAVADESVEQLANSAAFEARKEGFKAWWTVSFDEVQFLDASGAPFSNPVKLEDVEVDDPVRQGARQVISVGVKDENGILTGGIAGAWLAYQRDTLALDASLGEGRLKHVTVEFEKALKKKDEPALRASIAQAASGGEGIATLSQMVQYFGMNNEKSVRGDAKKRNRAEYLKQELQLHNKLPQIVQDAVRHYIIGLAAKESGFDAGLSKNSATAEGVMQLIDTVRVEHGHPADMKLSFIQEVDVAGKHFSNIYSRVRHWMKNEIIKNEEGKNETHARPETYATLRGLFPEGRQGDAVWQKFFLVPCMVNAYNAGSWTIGACLHEFVSEHSVDELTAFLGEPPGFDLFEAFTRFARTCDTNQYTQQYGEDAESYFVSIAAASEVLQDADGNIRMM